MTYKFIGRDIPKIFSQQRSSRQSEIDRGEWVEYLGSKMIDDDFDGLPTVTGKRA